MKLSPILALGALLFAGAAWADDPVTTLNGSVNQVVVDPSTPTTLYAAFAGTDQQGTAAGVYKSTDAGATWTRIFATFDPPFDIAIDPQSPSTLYVSAKVISNISDPGALYKSTDGGATWNDVTNGIPTTAGFYGYWMGMIAVDPVNEGVVYVATGATGLYKSTDGGQDWASIDTGISAMTQESYLPMQLLVDPVSPNTVYFNLYATNTATATQHSGLYKSTDGGAHWASSGLGAVVVYTAALDPQDHQHFVACADGILQYSSDGGATWGSGGYGCVVAPFPNAGSVVIDPSASEDVLVETDPGTGISQLRASSDGGQTLPSTVLSTVAMDSLVFDPLVPANVYAGTGVGVYVSRDGGMSWNPSASAPARVASRTSLKAEFSSGPDGTNNTSLLPGDTDDISVTIMNQSAATDATGIVYTVTLPSNLSLQDVQPEFGTCVAAGQVITCHATGLDLAPPDGFTDQFEVQATAAGPATITALITHVDQSLDAASVAVAQLPVVVGTIAADATTATAGNLSITADHVLLGTLSGSNPCGCGTPAYKIDTAPAHGSVAITNASTGAFSYTPANGYVGNDSFTFELNNGLGPATPATVQVTVQDIAPIATGGSVSVNAGEGGGTSLSFHPAYAGQNLTLSIVSPPAHGTVGLNTFPTPYYYSPDDPYVGPDSFTFKVTDQYGLDSNVATITITVKDPGVIAEPSFATTTPNHSVGGVMELTYIVFGQSFIYSAVSQPSHGTVVLDPSNNGQYTYTPTTGYSGPTDGFTYKVTDDFGASSTGSVTITFTDTAATTAGASLSIFPNTTLSGTLSATVAYTGQKLTFFAVAQPSHGGLLITGTTGAFTYRPASGYEGSDSFTFKAIDPAGKTSNVSTVQVSIGDTPAVAHDDSFTILPNVTLSGALTSTAAYGGQTLTYAIASNPSHGTVNVDPATGAFYYKPAQDYLGPDSFTFDVTDQYGTASNVATVQVTTSDVAPTVSDGSTTAKPGVSVAGTLSAAAAYPGQTLIFGIVAQPAHGTVSLNSTSGWFTYKPATGYIGTDSFTFNATDSLGTTSNTASETVTIADAAPTAYDASISSLRSIAVQGSLSSAPAYQGQILTYSIVSHPTHGTVSLTNASTGAYKYTPTHGYRGQDSFTFKVVDPLATASNVATVSITDH